MDDHFPIIVVHYFCFQSKILSIIIFMMFRTVYIFFCVEKVIKTFFTSLVDGCGWFEKKLIPAQGIFANDTKTAKGCLKRPIYGFDVAKR